MHKEHGWLHSELIGRILYVTGQGPWNKESVIEYIAALATIKKDLKQWGVLVNVSGDPVSTVDAQELLIKHIKSEKKSGRIATALVLTGSTAPAVGKWHTIEMYEHTGETYQFFENNRDAEIWLASQLK